MATIWSITDNFGVSMVWVIAVVLIFIVGRKPFTRLGNISPSATAKSVVTIKYIKVRSPSLPTFETSFIESMPAMMEKSTSGTTINFNKLRNIVPKGLIYVLTNEAWSCSSTPAITASNRAIPIWAVRESFFFSVIF